MYILEGVLFPFEVFAENFNEDDKVYQVIRDHFPGILPVASKFPPLIPTPSKLNHTKTIENGFRFKKSKKNSRFFC
jgi:hypothetical protein